MTNRDTHPLQLERYLDGVAHNERSVVAGILASSYETPFTSTALAQEVIRAQGDEPFWDPSNPYGFHSVLDNMFRVSGIAERHDGDRTGWHPVKSEATLAIGGLLGTWGLRYTEVSTQIIL